MLTINLFFFTKLTINLSSLKKTVNHYTHYTQKLNSDPWISMTTLNS